MKSIAIACCGIFLAVAQAMAGVDSTIPNRTQRIETGGKSTAITDRPNVVIISIECLRYDHTPFGGYARKTMPELKKFFQKGVSFGNAFTTSSWTLPSLVSVFTSTYPFEHGINRGFWDAPTRRLVMQSAIPDTIPWIPELFRKAGYRTFGFSTNPHTVKGTGFARGFDYYNDLIVFKNSELVNRQILGKRDELVGDSPFFLWVHYFDPHWQYWPIEPWISKYCPKRPDLPTDLYEIWVELLACDRKLKPMDPLFDYLVAAYDSEINDVDRSIRDLFRQLDLPTNTIYVLFSDHGEGFLEHGHMDHGNTLHVELTHVPLLLKWPDGSWKVKKIDDIISLLDLGPTLLDLCGLPIQEKLRGKSWKPRLEGERIGDLNRFILGHLANFEVFLSCVENRRYKLIRDDTTAKISVYDKQEDPRELRPMTFTETNRDWLFLKRVLEMEEKRRPRYKSLPTQGGVKVEEHLEEELRSLGYVK